MKNRLTFLLLLCFATLQSSMTIPSASDKSHSDNLEVCEFKGIPLHGKVQFVENFPDIKIQYVSAFPDIKVKMVEHFPDECGEWQVVENFPDFKVQIVDAFPDLKVQVVEHFPGVD
jgi:hypothetical protein